MKLLSQSQKQNLVLIYIFGPGSQCNQTTFRSLKQKGLVDYGPILTKSGKDIAGCIVRTKLAKLEDE